MRLRFNEIKQKKKLVVIDSIGGCYLNIAQELSKYFEVFYYSKYSNPFPMISFASIGSGYSNIRVVDNFWSNVDMFDIFLFPDIYSKDMGTYLRKMGKMVWGGCESEVLETDRKLFKQELELNGMSVAPTKYITGVTQLMKYLEDKQDKWIKVSYYRGNMETFNHVNMNQSKIWLDNLSTSMGPLGEGVEFSVEDSIDSIAEVGYDGWTINGSMTNNVIWGVETKDSSYVGTHTEHSKLPQPVIDTNNQFKSILQKYGHTGFYSTEVRVGKDGLDYYTDPCMRAGHPPSNVYMGLVNNWDEIIIGGCNGELIEPTYSSKYGCELILKTTYCNKNFTPITIDPDFRDNLRIKGSFNQDGIDYIVPFEQGGMGDMGQVASIVTFGDTPEGILKQAVEMANTVNCYGLSYDKDALNRSIESIKKIKETFNVEF